MKFKKPKQLGANIPTASMADIAFLLIIFFMVTTVFPVDKTIIELPTIKKVKKYNDDSAVIAISSVNLIGVREVFGQSLEKIAGKKDRVVIKASNGRTQSVRYYQHPEATWDMSDPTQFENLRDSVKKFLDTIDERYLEEARDPEKTPILIVIKADAKVPFYAVDGVIEALQDLGAQNIAILSDEEK